MINNLEELYYEQIRDLYSAETQLAEAIPEMASNATSTELRNAFNHYLEEARQHVERLREISERHSIEYDGETCEAMRGLIKEAKTTLAKTSSGDVKDAALIASANRVKHYEIAGYGVAKSFADCLGFKDDRKILDETLEEECAADQTLTKIATGGLFSSGVNQSAAS